LSELLSREYMIKMLQEIVARGLENPKTRELFVKRFGEKRVLEWESERPSPEELQEMADQAEATLQKLRSDLSDATD